MEAKLTVSLDEERAFILFNSRCYEGSTTFDRMTGESRRVRFAVAALKKILLRFPASRWYIELASEA